MAKAIDFSKRNKIEHVVQEERNGQVVEKRVWTSVSIDKKKLRRLKIHLVKKGVNLNNFFNFLVQSGVSGEITNIPNDVSFTNDIENRPFYMPESLKRAFKQWLVEQDVTMRQFFEYCIDTELSSK